MRLTASHVRSVQRPGDLFDGTIVLFDDGRYGVAKDKECGVYVLYRGPNVARKDNAKNRKLETWFDQAVAFHALVGSFDGFPPLEL